MFRFSNLDLFDAVKEFGGECSEQDVNVEPKRTEIETEVSGEAATSLASSTPSIVQKKVSSRQKSRKGMAPTSSKSSDDLQQPKSKRSKKSMLKSQPDGKGKDKDVLETNQKQRKHSIRREKKSITNAVERINAMSTAIIVSAAVKHQVPTHDNVLKEFSSSVTPSETVFLIEHLQKQFVELYTSCSTTKDKYLNFQFKWHHRF